MKISTKHLISKIKQKPDITDLSQKLFQLGHEHEISENIIDLELTPNRETVCHLMDCLGIYKYFMT